jgi:Mg2+ and Co2+ transporter CorA
MTIIEIDKKKIQLYFLIEKKHSRKQRRRRGNLSSTSTSTMRCLGKKSTISRTPKKNYTRLLNIVVSLAC